MSRYALVAVAVLMISVVAGQMMPVSADEKMSIKTVMKDHKGDDAPVQTIISGKADEATLKKFLAYYEFMGTQKPELGDTAAWGKKTAALVDATKGLIAKKDGSLEAFKSAVNCKACHTDHKPKKK
jgi:hypothetical protein